MVGDKHTQVVLTVVFSKLGGFEIGSTTSYYL
jgi:hypothetical protein